MTEHVERKSLSTPVTRGLYSITHFNEDTNPAGAVRAQQIQGESYAEAGFIRPEALEADGRMPCDLDRSRGPNVEYWLATSLDHPSNLRDQGCVRVVRIAKDGGLEDLPAYRYTERTLTNEAAEKLGKRYDNLGSAGVCEVAALSRTAESSPAVAFELIRAVLHDEWSNPRPRLWLITFADSAFRSIEARFGAFTARRCGPDVAIDVGDDRTSEALRLVPSLIDPSTVLDTMINEVTSTDDANIRQTLLGTLHFIGEGAPTRYRDRVNSFLGAAMSTTGPR